MDKNRTGRTSRTSRTNDLLRSSSSDLVKLAFVQGMFEKSAMMEKDAAFWLPLLGYLGTLAAVGGSAYWATKDTIGPAVEEGKKMLKNKLNDLSGQAENVMNFIGKPIPGLDKIPVIGQYMSPATVGATGIAYLLYKNLRNMNQMKKSKKDDNAALNKLIAQNENLINMAMQKEPKYGTNELDGANNVLGSMNLRRSRRRKKSYANLGENVLNGQNVLGGQMDDLDGINGT